MIEIVQKGNSPPKQCFHSRNTIKRWGKIQVCTQSIVQNKIIQIYHSLLLPMSYFTVELLLKSITSITLTWKSRMNDILVPRAPRSVVPSPDWGALGTRMNEWKNECTSLYCARTLAFLGADQEERGLWARDWPEVRGKKARSLPCIRPWLRHSFKKHV